MIHTRGLSDEISLTQKQTMGVDADLVTVLRDLVQFLECLCDVNLPGGLENVRANLLRRSRSSLVAVGQRSTSPEPYLDMNAGKGKGLLLIKATEGSNINDNQITEYIDADNPNSSRVSSSEDYYESFQEVTTHFSESTNRDYDDAEEKLKVIYRNFSAEQTISKCIKSGPLFQKEERRLFRFGLFGGFDQFRSCWIGLVGTHLLLYATKNDKQPSDVISIRGYSARPAPNSIPRDSERGKSAFEIFCPGDRTFQFLARTPKEMEQWVATICRAGCVVSTAKSDSVSEMSTGDTRSVIDATSTSSEEQYQDIGHATNEDKQNHSDKKDNAKNKGNENDQVELRKTEKMKKSDDCSGPPPLHARIPRRLPSLPHEESAIHQNPVDDCYDEDDIYHKIEDLKDLSSNYQNLPKNQNSKNQKHPIQELETYDDASEMKKKEKIKSKSKAKNFKQTSAPLDTYDDVQPAEIPKPESLQEDRTSIMYDDIEAIVDDLKKESLKETPRKKSFLDRVRYKKESPKKEENKKKAKQKSPTKDAIHQSQSQTSQQLPTYDDVSDLALKIKCNSMMENMADYTCPPAPRPIYAKPPMIMNSPPVVETEEFYDDIGLLRTEREEKSLNNAVAVNTVESSCLVNDEQSRMMKNLSQKTCDSQFEANGVDNELEHYQVPRSQDPIDSRGQLEVASTMDEELYDDIAILADFRARQRDSGCSTSSSDKTVTNVAKAWNRFASGRKSKTNDLSPAEKSKQVNSYECVDTSLDFCEEIDGLKLNKFQKLINKMECSLNKSTKTVPSMINKSHNEN